MEAVLKRQIDAMTENELKDIFCRDYLRRLARYRMMDNSCRKKYKMDFERFQKANVVKEQGYTFEIESDAQEWELAIDGIKTIERKLGELSGGN